MIKRKGKRTENRDIERDIKSPLLPSPYHVRSVRERKKKGQRVEREGEIEREKHGQIVEKEGEKELPPLHTTQNAYTKIVYYLCMRHLHNRVC